MRLALFSSKQPPLANTLPLLILCIIFLGSSTAYASEVGIVEIGLVGDGDDNSWREDSISTLDTDAWEATSTGESAGGAVHGTLSARATSTTALPGSNEPANLNIKADELQIWTSNASSWSRSTEPVTGLPNDELPDGSFSTLYDSPKAKRGDGTIEERYPWDNPLQERQSAGTQVFITANTCIQPTWKGSGTQTGAPPQLTLYISTSSSNTSPGPTASGAEQIVLPFDQGFVNYTTSASSLRHISVYAPSFSSNWTGGWNYEIAGSVDALYHRSNMIPFMYLIDTDTENALLVTENLTNADADSTVYKEWMNSTAPFILFAQNFGNPSVLGVQRSFCGLQNAPADIMASQSDLAGTADHVQMGMITRGLGNKPKQQFFVQGLNGTSNYYALLAMEGNSTASGSGVVGGGGQIWSPVNFTTKSDGNCALMFNLTFCNEVAYAVPSNPNTFPSIESLSAQYDNYAAQLYQNFTYSLQLIPCNTTDTAQYSLSKNCTDCANAYKEWLCAVSIPRCADFTSQDSWLQPRNLGQAFYQNNSMLSESFLQQPYLPMSAAPGNSNAQQQTFLSTLGSNSSRNPTIIDNVIMPGPYKEVKPCKDLCYSLVQSCPAALGFGCPYPGIGLEVAYGDRNTAGSNVTCSYLGAYYYFNAGSSVLPSRWAVVTAIIVGGVLWL